MPQEFCLVRIPRSAPPPAQGSAWSRFLLPSLFETEAGVEDVEGTERAKMKRKRIGGNWNGPQPLTSFVLERGEIPCLFSFLHPTLGISSVWNGRRAPCWCRMARTKRRNQSRPFSAVPITQSPISAFFDKSSTTYFVDLNNRAYSVFSQRVSRYNENL
jgi:hypothetical protein